MEFLEIGRIVKAHGLKGRLKVLSYLESGELLQSLDEVLINRDEGEYTRFRLKYRQVKGKCFYLEVEGVEDISCAEAFVGRSVLVPVAKLGPLSEGEYYWQQLLGLKVITEEGKPLGKVTEIFPTGSNDVLVCRNSAREMLLPAIAEVVRKIDLEEGVITVRLLEGL